MDLDVRYVAGLFDGEGWITICKQAGLGGYGRYSADYVRYQLVVGIGMSHRPLIERLHRQFGGGLHFRRFDHRMENARPGHLWKLTSNPASDFLAQVVPFLVVKREEAELAIEFQAHVRAHVASLRYGKVTREELYATREQYCRQIAALKKRAYGPPVDSDPVIASA